METEIGEEGNVLRPLLTLGQLCKDEEPSPSLAAPKPNTLKPNGQTIQERLSNATSPDDDLRSKVLVSDIDERENDTDGEDPFGDVKGDGWLDFRGPLIENEQVDGREGINSVDGNRYDERDEQVSICDISKRAIGFEVVEILETRLSDRQTLIHHPPELAELTM